MVEIQLPQTFCDPEKGCTTVQVINEHVAGLDERVQQQEESLQRLWSRVDATLDSIYRQNIGILIAGYGIITSLLATVAYQWGRAQRWWP